LLGPDPGEVRLDVKQILLTLPEGSTGEDIDAAMALVGVIRDSVSGCDDMVSIAAETDPSVPGDLGVMRLNQTPDDIRAVLSDLPLLTVSQPVRTARGIHLLMICDKIQPDSNLPNRDQIRSSLLLRQVDQVKRQYIRDLLRDAFIDIRI
jgi:peptidyl-prolyl cis-trans isomerase SurA